MSFSLQPFSAIVGDFLQCSFRGVPFAVIGSGGQAGRRTILHEYPGRDGGNSEDLGRLNRHWTIRGIIVGPLCYTQRDLLKMACEKPGPGLLIHPTLGILNVVCVMFEDIERPNRTNVIDVVIGFNEQKPVLSSLLTTGLHAAIAAVSITVGAISASGFTSHVNNLFSHGASVAKSARKEALSWSSKVVSQANAPLTVQLFAQSISGNNGRYNGNEGTLDTNEVLERLANWREGVSKTSLKINDAATANDLAKAVQNLADYYTNLPITDTGVRLALLQDLASVPTVILSPLQTDSVLLLQSEQAVRPWVQLLCQVSLAGKIAIAVSDWEPETSSEAQTAIEQVANYFDDLQTAAGNNRLDDLYQEIGKLAANTITALSQKIAALPDTITVTRRNSIPALTLAQQLYGDGDRAEELFTRANAIHPAFLPTSFEAKSA